MTGDAATSAYTSIVRDAIGVPAVRGVEQFVGTPPHRPRRLGLGEHLLDPIGELLGVARLEHQRRSGAADELGQPTGVGHDEGGVGGERLERDEPERFVQRRDDDAVGPMDRRPQLVVGQEAGKLHDVAHALEVDLRLELGKVRPASGDHTHDPRDTGAQRGHRTREHLEALLVLHTSPGEHDRPVGGRPAIDRTDLIVDLELDRIGGLVAGPDPPPTRIDTVRDPADESGVELEPSGDLADHQSGAGDDTARPERQPPLDGVDVDRLTGGEVTAVASALGAVQRRDERDAEHRGEHVGSPADVPVVGVDDVGDPVTEPRRSPDEGVVGGGGTRDLGAGVQPGHVDVGPHDPHPLDDLVDRARGVGAGEQHDIVPGAHHRPREAVDVGGHAAGGPWRVLPRKHQDAHGRAPYPGGVRRTPCHIRVRPPI